MVASAAVAGYSLLRYRAEGAAFYHVLHGHVPGHQIDFIYAPEVPQGGFTPTHYSHLTRLVKYVEPQPGAHYAFAIANLSRDDTQFEPGHGGLGLILGLRIEGAVDHTGRVNPPFAHALAGVDRNFTEDVLLEASTTFFRHILSEAEVERATRDFYQQYVQCAASNPSALPQVLESYVQGFEDLPEPERSALPWTYKAPQAVEQRISIVHDDDEPFLSIATAAARIASVLYKSNVRWTQVTTGGERDLPGGVTVRFVMRQNAFSEALMGRIWELSEVPRDERAIARELFGAEVVEEKQVQIQGWREKFAYQGKHEQDGRVSDVGASYRVEDARRPTSAGGDDESRSGRFVVPEEITRVAALETDPEDTASRTGRGRVDAPSSRPAMLPGASAQPVIPLPPPPKDLALEGRNSISNWPPARPSSQADAYHQPPAPVQDMGRRSSIPHSDGAVGPYSFTKKPKSGSGTIVAVAVGILVVAGVAIGLALATRQGPAEAPPTESATPTQRPTDVAPLPAAPVPSAMVGLEPKASPAVAASAPETTDTIPAPTSTSTAKPKSAGARPGTTGPSPAEKAPPKVPPKAGVIGDPKPRF